jgi:hypothetical protein
LWRKGVRHEEREIGIISQDEDGNVDEELQTYTVALVSRARLFAEIELGSMEQTEIALSMEDSTLGEAGQVGNGKATRD